MFRLTKKLLPFVFCFILVIGSCFSTFADGGSFNYSKLYIKNGSGIYENTTSNIITLKNYPTKVVFKRTDPSESVNVSGSHITIFDSSDNEVISFITGSEPKKLDGLLNGGETYTIKETKASYGHTPEVSELEIEIQDIADEQVFVIKDKVDDENGYWQLFNNDNTLKSSVKKETTTREVSSGERSIVLNYSSSSASWVDSSSINFEGYSKIRINHIYGTNSWDNRTSGGNWVLYNQNRMTNNKITSDSDMGAGFKLDYQTSIGDDFLGYDIENVEIQGTGSLSHQHYYKVYQPFEYELNEYNFNSFKFSFYKPNYKSGSFTIYYELIKEEEVSSFPKGFTKSKFYFYNDLERSVAGLSDRSAFFTTNDFDSNVNFAFISRACSSENELNDLTDDDFSSVSCLPDNNSYMINSCEFVPKYEVTYYLVKINGEEFKIKLETINTGIEVYGFQINASNSDGSASEYCPSFRTMSRSDKLQVKSDDTSDNKRLYPVENYGTVYAPDSVDDSEMTVLSDKAMHYQAHDEGFFDNYNNEYSMYYALTLKNLFYRYHNLTDKYKFRAYCELEDGTIIYSDNICTASVKDVAEAVYDKKISYSNITHQWIYDYVIYPTSLKSNIVNITYFLLEMTDAQSKDDLEYALCNQWYKDANYWCNNSFDYEKESYYDRGTKFVCTSEITHNGKTYNVESALLEILNDISVTKYDTVSDWIYYNQKEYQFEGIAYQKEFVNNQMIIFD